LAGLVPAIHPAEPLVVRKRSVVQWVAGTSPAKTGFIELSDTQQSASGVLGINPLIPGECRDPDDKSLTWACGPEPHPALSSHMPWVPAFTGMSGIIAMAFE
jgi:hypothetical protein